MYKNGNSTPNDEVKLKIAKYFNFTVDYLLGTSNTQSIDHSKNDL
ncbi:hypothetical protein [Clostridium sp. YIM B02555]|nr:hypothetical protein [Clostridium sp. YIM B02555]